MPQCYFHSGIRSGAAYIAFVSGNLVLTTCRFAKLFLPVRLRPIPAPAFEHSDTPLSIKSQIFWCCVPGRREQLRSPVGRGGWGIVNG